MRRSRTSGPRSSIAVVLCSMVVSGCAYSQMPRIDPTGQRLFVQQPVAPTPGYPAGANPGRVWPEDDVAVLLSPPSHGGPDREPSGFAGWGAGRRRLSADQSPVGVVGGAGQHRPVRRDRREEFRRLAGGRFHSSSKDHEYVCRRDHLAADRARGATSPESGRKHRCAPRPGLDHGKLSNRGDKPRDGLRAGRGGL